MSRTDIHKDGKETQFSKENQPTNRGRPKGSKNRKKILASLLSIKIGLNSDTELDKQLKSMFPELEDDLPVFDWMVYRLIYEAIRGKNPAKYFQLVIEHLDGKPTQSIRVDEKEYLPPEPIPENQFNGVPIELLKKLQDTYDEVLEYKRNLDQQQEVFTYDKLTAKEKETLFTRLKNDGIQ